MSTTPRYDDDDDNLYDSRDWSYSHHHDGHEDFQTVAASSIVDPWSQYNTRCEPSPPSLRTLSDTLTNSHAIHRTAPRLNVSPLEECRHPISTDATTYLGESFSQSPALSFDDTAVESTSLPGAARVDNNITTCEHCHRTFTGLYRLGNCARHVRHKHRDANDNEYPCSAPNCFKVYQRQDARLKHMRKVHPELQMPPVQRRHQERPSLPSRRRSHAASAPSSRLHTANQDRGQIPAIRGYLEDAMPNAERFPIPSRSEVESSHLSISTFANSPSAYGPFDPNLLSPYSPLYPRPTSLPPHFTDNGSSSRRDFPSPTSLQHDLRDFVDPSLLYSDDDGNEHDAPGFGYTQDYFVGDSSSHFME